MDRTKRNRRWRIFPRKPAPNLMRPSPQRVPLAGSLAPPRLAQPAVGELPHVAMAALRAVHQQGDRLDVLQAGAMNMDVQSGVDRLAGLRAAEDQEIHRAAIHMSNCLDYAAAGWCGVKPEGRLRCKFYRTRAAPPWRDRKSV